MKKIIFLSLFLLNGFTTFSQCKELIEELKSQQTTIDSLQDKVIKPLENEVSKLREQAKTLEKDKINMEQCMASQNINEIKADSLQKQIELLNVKLSEANKAFHEKDEQIAEAKRKNTIWTNAVDNYKNKSFDELIQTSTKLSVQRDMVLFSSDEEVKLTLSGLETYFNAEELLIQKFDATQIQNTLIQLNQIRRQSYLLEKLKENTKYYKDYNEELKNTIGKLVDLDKRKVAGDETEIQKLKFQEIISELSNYIYNYYDYNNYPYLSNIILEIIKRKHSNADANISDLLYKLN